VGQETGTQAGAQMTVRSDSLVVRDSEPIFTTIDDEVVMLSPRAQAYFGLGTIGSEIWNAIDKPRRVDELCAALLQDFEVDAETCRREVLDFLNDLVERGLAHVLPEKGGA
jgi:hypothetical protein